MKIIMQKPWYANALNRFRVIAVSEGISFLILLFIAMPLKYFAGLPKGVLIIGWIHGALFILYMIALLNVKIIHSWNMRTIFLAVIASVIPFGPFILERKILNKEIG